MLHPAERRRSTPTGVAISLSVIAFVVAGAFASQLERSIALGLFAPHGNLLRAEGLEVDELEANALKTNVLETKGPEVDELGVEALGSLSSAVRSGSLRVEYTLRHDQGEAPRGFGWGDRCPSCGVWHRADYSEYVSEERPLEASAWLLGPTTVLTRTPPLHPRFIEKTEVIHGGERRTARLAAAFELEDAVLLEIDGPIEGTKPIEFHPGGGKARVEARAYRWSGEWALNLRPFAAQTTIDEGGTVSNLLNLGALILDGKGTALGAAYVDRAPADGSWLGSPLAWPKLSDAELALALETTKARANSGILRVTLNFRSPKRDSRQSTSRYSEDDADATVSHVLGLLVSSDTVLVLANFDPQRTAYLEGATVHAPGDRAVPATFLHTLEDYGAFLIRMREKVEDTLEFASEPILSTRNRLLFVAEVVLHGETRVAHFMPCHYAAFDAGWRRKIFPELATDTDSIFVLDPKGRLVSLPLSLRAKVTSREERWSRNETKLQVAAGDLLPVLADPAAHADPNNIPLDETEENRIAWLGIEMQALDAELARVNNVSDKTRDGETGVIVTYVHPNSPAAVAGIEAGWILLRCRVEGEPQPLEVHPEDDSYSDGAFPWDRLEEIPEQYFESIPTPWRSVENEFTLALTELGFGRKYEAEFFHDDKVDTRAFEVVESPPHFGSVPRYKHEGMGITVRDLSFEVRQYFQRGVEEPGVIISKVEMGSKGSTAGLKPYEIVTHVNDEPVGGVKDFEKLTANVEAEYRLSVKRMTRGRTVKVQPGKPTQAPPGKESEEDPTSP